MVVFLTSGIFVQYFTKPFYLRFSIHVHVCATQIMLL